MPTAIGETTNMAQAMPPQMPAQADPLAQLRDIHLPAEISLWPAPGWWILGILLVGMVAWGSFRILNSWRENRYRSIARKELDLIYSEYQNNADSRVFLRDLQSLLKRVALKAYQRDKVASLNGELWVAFLDRSSGSNEFRMGAGQALIDSIYTKEFDADIDQLLNLGHYWIKKHKKLDELPGGAP